MRYKITNFYNNIKLKIFWFNFLILATVPSILYSNSTYIMSIEDIRITSDIGIEASIYIENVGSELMITSYQCALGINQDIDFSNLSLKYVEGSSELINEPNLYVGIDNIDGPTELTFVSYIGSDIISSKTLIGKFRLEGEVDISNIDLLGIRWDFEGTISTIITGKGFVNITDPSSHKSVFDSNNRQLPIAQVPISNSEASAVYGTTFMDNMLYDGITSSTNKHSSSEGRWAVSGFPQWVTIDLGEETIINHIKLDPFGSEDNITYDCEFYSGPYDNKEYLYSETTSTGSQWSAHKFQNISSRYLTIVFTGSKGNDWCDFWEVEVFGNNSATGIDDEEIADSENIPSEYSISQNYPNPFNPTTKVEVKMKENGNARLEIFNLVGERVLAVLDQELSQGTHEINIDGSSLASGIYFYKLDIGNKFSQVKKMNLIK